MDNVFLIPLFLVVGLIFGLVLGLLSHLDYLKRKKMQERRNAFIRTLSTKEKITYFKFVEDMKAMDRELQ